VSAGDDRRVDLVLEGGGVKAIGLVGALEVLEREGLRSHDVAGASAGAAVAALHAAGYTAGELRALVDRLDFRAFQDAGWTRRVPVLGAPLAILRRQGIHRGRVLHEWISRLLAARRVVTFRDLARPGTADPARKHRLQVIVSDLTSRELLALPRDAPRLGLDADQLDVALAVRASMGMPFVFEPVRVRSPETGREHVLVDGGVLSNFPVWIFDCEGPPARPTFGLLLAETDPRRPLADGLPPASASTSAGLRALMAHGRSLLQTVLEAHDRRHLRGADHVRTIQIPTYGVGAADFTLAPEDIQALHQSGVQAAEGFLATWDFDAYRSSFRTPPGGG
jgi:NTE family protein